MSGIQHERLRLRKDGREGGREEGKMEGREKGKGKVERAKKEDLYELIARED